MNSKRHKRRSKTYMYFAYLDPNERFKIQFVERDREMEKTTTKSKLNADERVSNGILIILS